MLANICNGLEIHRQRQKDQLMMLVDEKFAEQMRWKKSLICYS